MSDIYLRFKSYGLVPDQEYNLSNGTVFFMKGHNKGGKTTFINGIKSIMTVDEKKIDVVRHGDKEGSIIGALPGADGQLYQVRYEYDIKGKSKFIFLDPNGKVIKGIKEMRNIFNYTHITVSDFWNMSLSEKGRREQRELFINMLSDEEKALIINIDNDIESPKGILFKERTEVNSSISVYEKKVQQQVHTPEDLNIKNNAAGIKKTMQDVEAAIKKHEEIIELSKTSAIEKKGIDSSISIIEENISTLETNHSTRVDNINKKIEELKKELQEENESYDANLKKYNDSLDVEKEKLNKFKDINLENYEASVLAINGDPDAKDELLVLGLKKRKENGLKVVEKVNAIELKEKSWQEDRNELEKLKEKEKTLTDKINALREKKKELIKNSKNIPAGWSIEDDCVSYFGQKFYETEICLSDSVKAIAELMIAINDCPIMLMGDAECLGYEALKQLNNIAQENNRIMIFAEHDRTAEDVRLVCFDELEIPDKENNSNQSSSTLF